MEGRLGDVVSSKIVQTPPVDSGQIPNKFKGLRRFGLSSQRPAIRGERRRRTARRHLWACRV